MSKKTLADGLRLALAIAALIAVAACESGCAGAGKRLRAWISGDEQSKTVRTAGPKFSEQDSLKVNSDRRYQRMTKQRFEEEASIGQEAGSLWVMEGQGGYLFAQNHARVVGDLLTVKVEGAPKTQLQAKARVIAKLLDKLDRPELRGPASTAPAPAAAPAGGAAGATGTGTGTDAKAEAKNDGPQPPQVVPTRIVEALKDGSYRVKGSQPFMIGKREYKTIITGIVRAEDFDDAGVDAAKLLDAQFDIVGTKKGASI